ncbi:hypothetical protein CMV_019245 [Castanea mollissima]|uniref:Uncharacterized protein n=1 Tax=Castanea mollissima TaxID=60419 RepID=A0A8J4VEV7_9ROSI|nr:hypothetical protein CMV_019245 [Castanea mollissima]
MPLLLVLGFQNCTISMVHGPISTTPAYIESQTQVESRASLGYTSPCPIQNFKSKPKSDPYSAHSLFSASVSRLPSLRSVT